MSDLDLLRRLGDQIAPPSFDAIREAARRRSRRNATVATAVAAAAAAIVFGAVQHELIDHRSQVPPTPQPVDASRPITYADGATVHYGDHSVAMPDRVVELDLTDDGVAVRTADNRVWFTDGGEREQIGAIGDHELSDDESHGGDVLWGTYAGRVVSGNTGSMVAWYEFPQPDSRVIVVYDTDAGEVVDRYPYKAVQDAGVGGDTSGLYTVDSSAVYGFTDLTYGEGLYPNWRLDLDTGAVRPMYEPDVYQRILESGSLARILLVSHQQSAGPASFVPFDGLQQLASRGGQIEPLGEQPLSVVDGLTGSDFRFTAPSAYPNTNPLWLVQWLDDDTVVLHSEQPDGVDLLECQISTGACTIALEAPSNAVVPELG